MLLILFTGRHLYVSADGHLHRCVVCCVPGFVCLIFGKIVFTKSSFFLKGFVNCEIYFSYMLDSALSSVDTGEVYECLIILQLRFASYLYIIINVGNFLP